LLLLLPDSPLFIFPPFSPLEFFSLPLADDFDDFDPFSFLFDFEPDDTFSLDEAAAATFDLLSFLFGLVSSAEPFSCVFLFEDFDLPALASCSAPFSAEAASCFLLLDLTAFLLFEDDFLLLAFSWTSPEPFFSSPFFDVEELEDDLALFADFLLLWASFTFSPELFSSAPFLLADFCLAPASFWLDLLLLSFLLCSCFWAGSFSAEVFSSFLADGLFDLAAGTSLAACFAGFLACSASWPFSPEPFPSFSSFSAFSPFSPFSSFSSFLFTTCLISLFLEALLWLATSSLAPFDSWPFSAFLELPLEGLALPLSLLFPFSSCEAVLSATGPFSAEPFSSASLALDAAGLAGSLAADFSCGFFSSSFAALLGSFLLLNV
jgi:hypothetical protein